MDDEWTEGLALRREVKALCQGGVLGRSRERGAWLDGLAHRGESCLGLARRLAGPTAQGRARALALAAYVRLARGLRLLARHHPHGPHFFSAALTRAERLSEQLRTSVAPSGLQCPSPPHRPPSRLRRPGMPPLSAPQSS